MELDPVHIRGATVCGPGTDTSSVAADALLRMQATESTRYVPYQGYTGLRAEWLLFLDGSSAGVRDELDALLPGRCSGSGYISANRY